MRDPDIRSNAGRCDWCGKPINMNDGDELVISDEEDFKSDEHDFSAEDCVGAVADALERIGGPKDDILVEQLREEHGYRLHERCFKKSALSELYTGTPSLDDSELPDSSSTETGQ